MKYGFGYQGSKSRIAEEIISQLPPAKNFYDLFHGGGAIAHAAALSGKYEHVYASDISSASELLKMAVDGEFDDFTPEWIARDEFFKRKDPYTKIIWSFGSKGKGYLFSGDREEPARMAHEAVVNQNTTELMEYLKSIGCLEESFSSVFEKEDIESRRKAWNSYCRKINKPTLGRLEYLERISRLKALSGLNIHVTQQSYEKVKIQPDSVVYCDIPYRVDSDSSSYTEGFNHEYFYRWLKGRRNPTYVSEYSMPSIFPLVWKKQVNHLMKTKKGERSTAEEKLFWNGVK